ncbi:MAG: SDR family NAD(P)-dependent oxidoreductase [Opitutales bacterium]|nr:SDR family NAD(P)-dependent oxidoreductase [Opitutales bacterium]
MTKLVCISGCSRGLGRAMAIEFSNRGWQIAGGARDTSALKKLKFKLITDNFLHPFVITQPEEVDKFSNLTKDKLGIPNLLVNNAGLINKKAPLTQVQPDEFASVLAVNLGGIHNMIRSFVPMMQKAGRGIIANFSSYWGQSTAPEVGPYCATKWGVEGLTRALAQELPSGLGAVAFNPGVINTDMLRSTFGNEAKEYENPNEWAMHAVSRLEALSPSDSGNTVIG